MDTTKPTYDELVTMLDNVVAQACEDCPVEYRTRHFNDTMEDARELMERARA